METLKSARSCKYGLTLCFGGSGLEAILLVDPVYFERGSVSRLSSPNVEEICHLAGVRSVLEAGGIAVLESGASQSGGPGPAALVSHGGSFEMHIFGAYPR